MEYHDMGFNPGMKKGYRLVDRTQFSRVKKFCLNYLFLKILPILVGTLPQKVNLTTGGEQKKTGKASFKNPCLVLILIVILANFVDI